MRDELIQLHEALVELGRVIGRELERSLAGRAVIRAMRWIARHIPED